MTVLDNFIAFARALPSSKRQQMEDSLAALMASYSERYDFTSEELADLHGRAAEAHPDYSDPRDIAKLFGKPFRS